MPVSFILRCIHFFLPALLALSGAAPAMLAAEAAPPLPGFTTTRGGEGGRVIRVTTTAASGKGSLAAALAANGPRHIVFDVGGIIDLGNTRLAIRNPHVTIAGETAPSPGITLIRGGLVIGTHDVIVRHLRVRPGASRAPAGRSWDIDGIATGRGAHDVIVDQCSISWATDENLSASGPRFSGSSPGEWRRNTSHRITFSRCIVAEALHRSTHSKATGHSKGSLIHDNATDIAIVGNLYISNQSRNPLFKGGASGVVVNNYICNPGGPAITYGLVPQDWEGRTWIPGALAIVGNIVRHGPSTAPDSPAIRFGSDYGVPLCHAFVHDNRLLDREGRPRSEILAVYARPGTGQGAFFRLHSVPPVWPDALKARRADDVVEWVLAHAGARPWERDAVDRRLVEEARTGGGRVIDSELEVGGYEVLQPK